MLNLQNNKEKFKYFDIDEDFDPYSKYTLYIR